MDIHQIAGRKTMKVLYHSPTLHSIYAQRTILNGYRNAFTDMGHEFQILTADLRANEVFSVYRPDLFITSSFSWYRKYLNFQDLKQFRREGMFTLVKVDFWDSPLSAMRINEAPSLKNDREFLDLTQSDLYGDAYFHVVEQDDMRMDGFSKTIGSPYHSIPLAADKISLLPAYENKFASDVAYIGTNLPDKREFFKKNVLPLGEQWNLKIYGQDWSKTDYLLGWAQRAGQYFNIPMIRSLRKPKLQIEDEAKIYYSASVSINVHEAYQREFGGDCNERTFKIPLCRGFEVVDSVSCIKKYFSGPGEIVMADNDREWVELIHHYLHNPDDREAIINAGHKRVLGQHTYHHRAQQMINIMSESADNTI